MMKLPNEETQENNHHSDGDGYLSDDYEGLEMIPAPIRDGDFSEYMWMENEEEFNSQVMRELVEQELMEECIAVHEDYGPLPLMNNLTESVNILSISSSNGVRSTNGSSNSCSSPSQNVPSSEQSVRGSAQQRLDRIRIHQPSQSQPQTGKESTLNPYAKEFVPTSRTSASSSEDENDKLPS